MEQISHKEADGGIAAAFLWQRKFLRLIKMPMAFLNGTN